MRSLRPRLPTLWLYSARELQRRPGRLGLTLLGIVIGVATIVAIAATTRSTRRAYGEMFEAVNGRATLEVVAEGAVGFSPDWARRLAGVPGVRAAAPVVEAPAGLLGRSGTVPVLVLGIDLPQDAAVRTLVLREGRRLDAASGVLLEAGFARSQGIGLNQEARLLTATGIQSLPVIGLLEPRGAATFNGGAIAFVRLDTAQRLFRLVGEINGVQIIPDNDVEEHRVEEAIRLMLADGLLVQRPRSRGEPARQSLLMTDHGLSFLSVASVVAGAFVILNTFMMGMEERRKNLAILRALGATRGQVARLLAREAAVLGLMGAFLGVPAGWLLAWGLAKVLETFMGATLPALQMTAMPVVLGFLLGPTVTLAATFVPAQRASRRAPLDELLHKRSAVEQPPRPLLAYLGVAGLVASMTLAGAVLMAGLSTHSLSALLVCMAVGLSSAVFLLPLLVPSLLGVAEPVLRRALGIEGQLGVRQLRRNRGRTTLTVGVLVIALGVSVGFGNTLLTNIRDVQTWMRRILEADYYIRGVIPDATAVLTAASLPESLVDDLRSLPGVERVDRARFILGRVEGRQVIILARTFSPSQPLPLDLDERRSHEVLAGLLRGEAVVGTALARQLGVSPGAELTLETADGPKRVRVAATTTEYMVGGMALYLEWGVARRLFKFEGIHVALIQARAGQVEPLGARLGAFCKSRGLSLQSAADLGVEIDRMVSGVVGSLWSLMALIFLVASLGVINTLTTSVLDQVRDIGVLRALGMVRGQVRRVIIAEAITLGLVSLAPGLALGVGLAFLINQSITLLLGHEMAFALDLTLAIGCSVIVLIIAVAASLGPARRAARIEVIQALHQE
jgi:putative ABC transport system permease protein